MSHQTAFEVDVTRLDPRPTLQIAKAVEPCRKDIGLEYPHLQL